MDDDAPQPTAYNSPEADYDAPEAILRDMAADYDCSPGDAKALNSAADTIDALRQALRRIADLHEPSALPDFLNEDSRGSWLRETDVVLNDLKDRKIHPWVWPDGRPQT